MREKRENRARVRLVYTQTAFLFAIDYYCIFYPHCHGVDSCESLMAVLTYVQIVCLPRVFVCTCVFAIVVGMTLL